MSEERYTYSEEGVGRPKVSTQLDKAPGEPEKLRLPAESVAELLQLAVQSPGGNLWWRGFVTAHGLPSWIASGHWRFQVRGEAEVVPDHSRENGRA